MFWNNNPHNTNQLPRVGDYIIEKQIGKGAFATVYKGYHQTTKEEVAIKIISRRKSNSFQYNDKEIEKEISILKTLNHSNIVKFIHFEKNPVYYFLIFEFCENGDLETVINTLYNGQVPEAEAQQYIQQIIEGIKAMKARNIVHRDLKLANILVSKNCDLKIADFGLARFIEQDDPLLKTFAGTPLTMDPLMLEQNNYNEKCDIWSLGIIFYQILTGRIPFNPGKGATFPHFVAYMKTKPPIVFPTSVPLSDSFKNLIRSMLDFDVDQRISFEDLFNHEWITGKNLLSASELLKSKYQNNKYSPADSEQSLIKNLSDNEKQSYLCSAVFLAEAYEIFQPKLIQLKELLVKVQRIKISKEIAEKDKKLVLVPILLSLDVLRFLREILTFEFNILGENNQDVILKIDFATFCEKVMENKAAMENFMGKETVITDLYNQAKSDYLELSHSLSSQLQEWKNVFEEFYDYDQETILIDFLIQLNQDIAEKELEQTEEKLFIEQYDICYQMSECLIFKNSFELNFPKISIKSQIEELKDFNADHFHKSVAEFFNQKNMSSSVLLQLSQIEDVKKTFKLIQNLIVTHESQNLIAVSAWSQTLRNRFNQTLRGLQDLLAQRINDIKGVKDIEITF